MTGRGAGLCAGFPVPGFLNMGFGRGGFGRGRGRGRGWRNWHYATGLTGWQRSAMGWPAWGVGAPGMPLTPTPPSKEQEIEMLRQQAENLSGALDEVTKRIDELESKARPAQ